ncbi:MAG TPA: MBL fold metallo-hydrolase [Polyangiaceae bacterium]|nr:MBL fold metallo-hydrolase [Polyangiaceae bacterium]
MKNRTALVKAAGVRIELHSFRLNNFIKASLHYLAMGRVAHDVGKVYAAMSQASREGARDWFETSDAARYFRRAGNELFLNDDLYFGSEPTLFDPDLRVAFSNLRADTSLHVPVDAELLGFFGRLLPQLRASVPLSTTLDSLDKDERTFVEQLKEAGFLEEAPLRSAPPRRDFALRLLGHAGLSLETPSARVLFDPLMLVRDQPEVNLLDELCAGVDAIVISHPHWDHFNFDTLLHVPRNTVMIVPALNHPPSLENIDMAALLRQLGFRDVRTLSPWESTQVGEACITATPFYGEQSGPDVPQDWMTYHVSAGGRAFFGAVDACHNSHASMDSVMRRVHESLPQVDALFAPYSGFHYPIAMFTRRPFYMGPGMEQYSGGPDDAVRWCSLLGAAFLVPYAGFVWTPRDYERPEDRTHRGSLRRLRSMVKAAPRGPLLVLEPRERALFWSEGGPLQVPQSLDQVGVGA